MTNNKAWQFWIDRGGTFTDVVALRPDGRFETCKLLSENRQQYKDAAAEAVRRLIAAWEHRGEKSSPVAAIKMGTTVATNALLERNGAPTALVVTRGFRDSIDIGYQSRPDIFALHIRKPDPLYARVIEVDGRVGYDGSDLYEFIDDDLKSALQQCVDDGISGAAICLMHAYRYPDMEKRVAELAREAGFSQVSVSHDVEPLIKFVSRAETTLADAYLSPVIANYINQLRSEIAKIASPERMLFMQSNGGLVDARYFRGKNSVLSGPAAGVVGMVESGKSVGLEKLVGFDMGGTSTDVSTWSGRYQRSTDSEISGVTLRSPMLKIHTIAAGGSSVLSYTDGRFIVGPDSAGADPGPASYRNGGPLTVTDANVCLGRIPLDSFPKIFGPGGNEPLDSQAANKLFEDLADKVTRNTGVLQSATEVAAGFLTVAVENMANAIRKITVERGEDVRDFTLCCFGGAGGQHACRVADVLGINSIWIHPMAGVLSAYGMGLSDIRSEHQQSIDLPLDDENEAKWRAVERRLLAECDESMIRQDVPTQNRTFSSTAGIRISGSDTVIDVSLDGPEEMRREFQALYLQRFGASSGAASMIVSRINVAAIGKETEFEEPVFNKQEGAAAHYEHRLCLDGQWTDVAVYQRESLGSGAEIDGPAIIAEENGTTVVERGWSARVNQHGHLVMSSITRENVESTSVDSQPDPVRLEVFNQLFMHIAEQMGAVLQNMALSVNIRERLDFSCALFDSNGRLVSNAPHMPVHLGSMGESVRSVISAKGPEIREGDTVMLNSPYNGGTHLPDVTVVTPWFGDEDKPQFWFASRAHHADIGGITPGSMPSNSRHIDDEGVLIDNFFLVRGGELQEIATRELLTSAKFPARNPDQNLADLKAQLAANQQGARQLQRAIDRYGLATVKSYLRFVRENAADSVRRLLGTLRDGEFQYEMDSGEVIAVKIGVDHEEKKATIDFTGTSTQSGGNFNAPEAVTRAAVLYVFRSLIDDAIPMNEGCLEPLQIIIPQGSMLSPSWPAAVVAGNVETSQCVTDTLYGALGTLAASQGTMNNLTFGNSRVQYYETIAGGSGAGNGFHGADAVQTHMTNSRLTDPEVLEQNFPVVLEEFSIRPDSGGNGKWHGGNGAIRRMRFTENVELSILSNHRRIRPFGADGGDDARPGVNRLIRSDGTEELLSATASAALRPGDCVHIETPGGGGFGDADS